jgi:hypothetical protein
MPPRGGDPPEGVERALAFAVHKLRWRRTARRIVILIGDSPPRLQNIHRAYACARSAARKDVVISTVLARNFQMEAQVLFFRRIARIGRGKACFLSGQKSMAEELLPLCFGIARMGNLARIIEFMEAEL